MARLGFIGIGMMGLPLAEQLVRQHELIVFDPDPGRVAILEGQGAVVANSPAELASQAEAVFLCLPTSDVVSSVVRGSQGLFDHLVPDSVIVDMTSGDPRVSIALALEAEERSLHYVDAPVSGGPGAATAGNITIMVGAGGALFMRIKPILETISSRVFCLGKVGAGHTVKLINNLLAAAHRLLAIEALAIAVENGLDLPSCFEVINISSGRSYATESTVPRHFLSEPLSQNFALRLMEKDVRLAVAISPASMKGTSIGSQVAEIFNRAMTLLADDADVNEIVRVYEDDLGMLLTAIPVGYEELVADNA